MALHHFIWQGKERAVALNREADNKLLLDFVDDDIIKNVSSRIVLDADKENLVNEVEIISTTKVEELLAAIEQSIGKPVTTFLSKTSLAYQNQ